MADNWQDLVASGAAKVMTIEQIAKKVAKRGGAKPAKKAVAKKPPKEAAAKKSSC